MWNLLWCRTYIDVLYLSKTTLLSFNNLKACVKTWFKTKLLWLYSKILTVYDGVMIQLCHFLTHAFCSLTKILPTLVLLMISTAETKHIKLLKLYLNHLIEMLLRSKRALDSCLDESRNDMNRLLSSFHANAKTYSDYLSVNYSFFVVSKWILSCMCMSVSRRFRGSCRVTAPAQSHAEFRSNHTQIWQHYSTSRGTFTNQMRCTCIRLP